MSRNRIQSAAAASWYWLGGAALFSIAYYGELFYLFIPIALLLAAPLYGLTYFIDASNDLEQTLICIGIAYAASLAGWYAGRMGKRPKAKVRE
ncbi:hypothetical protein [Paenibacillus thailandensis]|uniref:Uncharacterized protein n=1 Tax=Paenibacillus thailandensis TaxID=393250 RepID=A0ABW5QZ46_9BACL